MEHGYIEYKQRIKDPNPVRFQQLASAGKRNFYTDLYYVLMSLQQYLFLFCWYFAQLCDKNTINCLWNCDLSADIISLA